MTISNARWAQSQFNPTIAARAAATFLLSEHVRVSVRVIDMNGRVVRTLGSRLELDAGSHELPWDGRDDSGRLVPDGAYRLVVEKAKRREPGSYAVPPSVDTRVIPVRYYDRRSGTIAYDLPSTSLVSIVANAQLPDGGSVTKLVASAVARPTGAVIEPWDGLDQSGVTRIPELPGFTIRIEATPLPADTILTYGERNTPARAVGSPNPAVNPEPLPPGGRGVR